MKLVYQFSYEFSKLVCKFHFKGLPILAVGDKTIFRNVSSGQFLPHFDVRACAEASRLDKVYMLWLI